jgi:hypothetical protein
MAQRLAHAGQALAGVGQEIGESGTVIAAAR